MDRMPKGMKKETTPLEREEYYQRLLADCRALHLKALFTILDIVEVIKDRRGQWSDEEARIADLLAEFLKPEKVNIMPMKKITITANVSFELDVDPNEPVEAGELSFDEWYAELKEHVLSNDIMEVLEDAGCSFGDLEFANGDIKIEDLPPNVPSESAQTQPPTSVPPVPPPVEKKKK